MFRGSVREWRHEPVRQGKLQQGFVDRLLRELPVGNYFLLFCLDQIFRSLSSAFM